MDFKDIRAKRIDKKEFDEAGKVWPLTVESGLLIGRQRDNALIFIDEAERVFGVNGIALGLNFKSIAPIWAFDPFISDDGIFLRKNINDLINVGNELLSE